MQRRTSSSTARAWAFGYSPIGCANPSRADDGDRSYSTIAVPAFDSSLQNQSADNAHSTGIPFSPSFSGATGEESHRPLVATHIFCATGVLVRCTLIGIRITKGTVEQLLSRIDCYPIDRRRRHPLRRSLLVIQPILSCSSSSPS